MIDKGPTIEQYLKHVAQFAEHAFGKVIRQQFASLDGASELAVLACPTRQELEQLRRVVAIMTEQEKANAKDLTDQQIRRLAEDAKADPGLVAIFFNGYAIQCKRVP